VYKKDIIKNAPFSYKIEKMPHGEQIDFLCEGIIHYANKLDFNNLKSVIIKCDLSSLDLFILDGTSGITSE
jgi:hypothetical protein